MHFHNLGKLSQHTIYVNAEQSAKPSFQGGLTQEGIDRAFSGKQRQSNLVYKCDGTSVFMISGKNTGHLGVQTISGPENIKVTDLERTLIDIAVRPAYAGGISQVLEAYRGAKERSSVDRLLEVLKRLDYVYPYHQAIGFLMETSGYPEGAYAKMRQFGLHHDFYLVHGMKEREYSKEWRLFYPKHLLATPPR